MRLCHVSEDGGLERFAPRLPANRDAGVAHPVVWAVDEAHLANYLLPRDCPRVCLRADAATTLADAAHFLAGRTDAVVIAIEDAWFERARTTLLWIYEFPAESFLCADATAGYYVSSVAVTPRARQCVARPLDELAARGVELRVLPQGLRELAQAVQASSLAYSCIRLRNASPRRRAGTPT